MIKTIKHIFNEYGITKDDLNYLGQGENGEAMLFKSNDNDYVLKYTNSISEINAARKLKELQQNNFGKSTIYDHSAVIFEVGKFTNDANELSFYDYFILMEYLDVDGNLGNDYDEYFENYYNGTLDEYQQNNPELFEAFHSITKIEEILGVSDMHAENLGYSNSGVIKGFDWDLRK